MERIKIFFQFLRNLMNYFPAFQTDTIATENLKAGKSLSIMLLVPPTSYCRYKLALDLNADQAISCVVTLFSISEMDWPLLRTYERLLI